MPNNHVAVMKKQEKNSEKPGCDSASTKPRREKFVREAITRSVCEVNTSFINIKKNSE